MIGPDSGGAPAETSRSIPSYKAPELHARKNFTPFNIDHFAEQKYDKPDTFGPGNFGKPTISSPERYGEPTINQQISENSTDIPPELQKMFDEIKFGAGKEKKIPEVIENKSQTENNQSQHVKTNKVKEPWNWTPNDINNFIKNLLEKIKITFRNLVK